MTSDELYERLLDFAKLSQGLAKNLPKTITNIENGSQLIRSSASPGANYIEALEASSPKDFCYRLKVCRKETRESTHWLALIQADNQKNDSIFRESNQLIAEAKELIRIFTASIFTSERNQKNKY